MMMNAQISLKLSGNKVDHLGQADGVGQLRTSETHGVQLSYAAQQNPISCIAVCVYAYHLFIK